MYIHKDLKKTPIKKKRRQEKTNKKKPPEEVQDEIPHLKFNGKKQSAWNDISLSLCVYISS